MKDQVDNQIYAVFDQFQQALVVSGIAAVAGAVIGAPICMVVIVLELTNSYSFALASLVGLAISVTYLNLSGKYLKLIN